MLLCKYHDVTLAANDAAFTLCYYNRKLILAAVLLKISQINFQTMYIQKIEK